MKSKQIMLAALLVIQACTTDPEPEVKDTKNPLDFTDASGTILTIAEKAPQHLVIQGMVM